MHIALVLTHSFKNYHYNLVSLLLQRTFKILYTNETDCSQQSYKTQHVMFYSLIQETHGKVKHQTVSQQTLYETHGFT